MSTFWPGSRSGLFAAISAVLVLIAVVRIVASYPYTAQCFDETCHVAAGMEFLDKNTYTLDPTHPTLARIAIGLPLYLARERYPKLAPNDPGAQNYNVVGNHILYDSGHFQRNIILARIGVLPFFLFGAVMVYLWAQRLAGDWAATIAVFLYSTTPTILAFSSIAYTDIVAASTQLAAIFAFTWWLESQSGWRTFWFGIALGLALLSKLTTVLFVPAAGLGILMVWYVAQRHRSGSLRFSFGKLLAAAAIAAIVLWGGYRFSIRHLQQATGITAASMPSFQRFPARLRSTARELVLRDPRLPAAELFRGVAEAYALNRSISGSYIFGKYKAGGWWYFFLVGLAVKLPLPLLLLFLLGAASAVRSVIVTDGREARLLFPLIAIVAILLVTANVKYQVGIRHVLVTLPLIAIVAGTAAGPILEREPLRSFLMCGFAALVLWQVVESARSQSDFLAYFNELAGKDPSSILVMGCDLDCGQDLYRLAHELQVRHVDQCALAVWSSADIARLGLPANSLPPPLDANSGGMASPPNEEVHPQSGGAVQDAAGVQHDSAPNPPLHGCVALSARAFRLGDVLHQNYGPEYFGWLKNYRPVATVGRTILLYEIPENSPSQGK